MCLAMFSKLMTGLILRFLASIVTLQPSFETIVQMFMCAMTLICLLGKSKKRMATIVGNQNVAAGMGTVKWKWRDDTGTEHTHLTKDVLYFPASPINILSVTEFSNQLNDDDCTGIDTARHQSCFYWNHKQFSRKLKHPSSNLPEMRINRIMAKRSFSI